MKKLISILSAVLIVCNMITVTATDNDSKEYYIDGEKFEERGDFLYYPNTKQIFAYIGDTDKNVVIPEGSDITRMLTINNKSFGDKSHVKTLTISNNVKFEHVSLEADTIILEEGIKAIPYEAFSAAKVTNVVFPQSLETIGDRAFRYSGLKGELVLPDNLKTIGKDAFRETNITRVTMSDSVTYIDDRAFEQCTNLTEAHLSNNLTKIGQDVFRATPMKKINVPDKWNVTQADCGSFGAFATGTTVDYEINREMTVELFDHLQDKSSLKKYCRSDKLKNYADGDDWWVIGDVLVNYEGNSSKPVIPDFITEINGGAFANPVPHETIVIPPSVKKLDDSCFVMFFMDYLVVPDTVEEIGASFVGNTQLLELTINGSPKISKDALKGSNFLLNSKLHIDPNCKLPNNFNMEDLATEEWWLDDPAYIPYTTPDPKATPAPTTSTETTEPTEKPTVTPTATATPETLTVEGGEEITVKVNDKTVEFPDAKPFVDENDRTQVPIRAVSELLNCNVDWQQETATAVITKDNGDTVKITLASDVMTINDKPIQMDTAAMLKDDRTFIPVRFVAEALGLTVKWVE